VVHIVSLTDVCSSARPRFAPTFIFLPRRINWRSNLYKAATVLGFLVSSHNRAAATLSPSRSRALAAAGPRRPAVSTPLCRCPRRCVLAAAVSLPPRCCLRRRVLAAATSSLLAHSSLLCAIAAVHRRSIRRLVPSLNPRCHGS
jgi:hypothetical protein